MCSVLASFEAKKKTHDINIMILIHLALVSIKIIPNGNLLALILFKERHFLGLSQLQ